MQLIIVESPTKARTLAKFLGQDYQIEASMGHIRDLPKSELGVDVENNFTPRYIVPRLKAKRAKELKEAAKKADAVILATDPDREGEAIAFHVAELLKEDRKAVRRRDSKKKSQKQSVSSDGEASRPALLSFSRIAFHEITESAIKDALAHPREIDLKLVDAQQARRVLDRLVGYKLSPLLWQKLSRRWLSAGRVQSVAVRLIVEREREIAKFAKVEYWTIEGEFQGAEVASSNSRAVRSPAGTRAPSADVSNLPKLPGLVAQLVSKDGVKYEKALSYDLFDGTYTTTSSTIRDEAAASTMVKDLRSPFTVSAVDKKEIRRHPAPPYTTSTLQQDAARKLYFSAKRTMQLAQKLYEEGYITYHRTDSVNIAEKFIAAAREYIGKNFGSPYVPAEARRYKTKSKNAQEAHEAIRPTDVEMSNDQFQMANGELNKDHKRLYELIWKRALACQAAEAVFDSTTIDIASSNGYLFETTGGVVKFDGFLKIIGRDTEEMIVPDVTVGQTLDLSRAVPAQHFTQPPPRYSEASLVKTLEEKGIGRPSTYAPIISTIQDRQYVTREDKRLVPTELGFTVNDFLVKYFPDIITIPFTATLEDGLDAIAAGERDWVPLIAEFYTPFAQAIESTFQDAEKVKVPVEAIDEKCPECGNGLVIRVGRYGKFVACSTFPACKYTRQFAEKINMPCPRCGGDIVIKKTRRGKMFYGCSNYPTCTFAAWKKEDIK